MFDGRRNIMMGLREDENCFMALRQYKSVTDRLTDRTVNRIYEARRPEKGTRGKKCKS